MKLPLIHLRLLSAVYRSSGTQKEIADELNISQPSMSRHAFALIEAGLLKVAQGYDRRQNILEITEEGRKIVESICKLCGGTGRPTHFPEHRTCGGCGGIGLVNQEAEHGLV